MKARATLAAALVVAAALAAAPSASADGGRPSLRVGTRVLHPCRGGGPGWCGTLPRRLDPARADSPRIGIAFRWLPPQGRARGPAIVAVEGGPGYPSTGSLAEYTGIYEPLMRERGLLLVDNRGTGGSALIGCPRLQSYTGVTSGPGFPALVAGCAREIERRYARRGRRALHAADLFGTAYAADDLAAVMRALRTGRVDLYGDSYGTWFAQSFIARHPRTLHSVVLDSAYPVRGLDPWYASSGAVARSAMDAVCARDPGCAAAAPGSATARLGALLAVLRRRPIAGRTRGADGAPVRARVDVRAMTDMVQDAASDPVIYRELDASIRAALAGDDAPLLRLAAQSAAYDHGVSEASYFSNGLYMAVACFDYPQLFSMSASPARRRDQFAARLSSAPDAFRPFTPREWVGVSAYTQPYRACLDWPAPRHTAPPVPPRARPLPASVPVLILGGDLDSLTPQPDTVELAPRLGARSRTIALRNSVHVTSEGDTYLAEGTRCARAIIRGFVRAPARIARLDASCAGRIPPIHTPGAYPRTLGAAGAATLASGPDPGLDARRAATVAAGALGDAVIRRVYSGAAKGPGLRGGAFSVRGDEPARFHLRAIRFVADATVDGHATWRPSAGAAAGTLTVRPPRGGRIVVGLRWTQRSTTARATVGRSVLSLPAP